MALEIAQEGGTSRISSGARVYNELAATRPDLIHTLTESWPLDSFGGDPGYTARPVLYYEDGHVIIQYSRRNFTGYGKQKRTPHIPPITEAQAEALDAVHFLAEKYSLGLNFQKGDIQYINSLGLLHARDAFKDSEQHTLVLHTTTSRTNVCLLIIDLRIGGTWFVYGCATMSWPGAPPNHWKLSGNDCTPPLPKSSVSPWNRKFAENPVE